MGLVWARSRGRDRRSGLVDGNGASGMKRRFSLWLLLVLLFVFGLGVTWLFDLRLSGGDIYPPYSTLRADPLGTRALHDALQRLPEVEVERSLKPLRKLPENPPRTI